MCLNLLNFFVYYYNPPPLKFFIASLNFDRQVRACCCTDNMKWPMFVNNLFPYHLETIKTKCIRFENIKIRQ